MHNYDIRESGCSLPQASRALILLHGRGATAEDILPLAGFFAGDNWYVAAPQATGRQWYPHSFMAPAEKNEPWLGSAIGYVSRLIDDISQYVDKEKIYLAGFSQGACLSAEVAARTATRYGGLGVFTGGLIGERIHGENYSGDFMGTRIYISNGDNDPHIPLSRSEETQKQLKGMGAEVMLDIFPGRDHIISTQEIERAGSFILQGQI